MQAISSTPQTVQRPQLVSLSRLTMIALVGLALALIYAQLALVRQFDLALTVFAGLMLLGSGLVASGWRWTPLVGALLSALVVAGNSGPVIYDLTHPEPYHNFAFMVIAVALSLVGCVSGILATTQNYRGNERRAPRATTSYLALLTGLCAGALLIGALPQSAGAAVSPELLASLPALSTPGMYFDQTTLRAQVGATVALRLDNPHGVSHAFDIDALNVHIPVVAGEQSLILFKPEQPGTYSFYCGLPGHRQAGMVGTLIVEP
ncbi:MAG: cupredoxin domain-containing protein [Roseiflexaceae bacterium]|nr:cupredoxin domain-containing protein [Roseiflexaceae bacterium]